MYAVIFKAKILKISDAYSETSKKMRELAIEEYGCLKVSSVLEGGREITIPYWKDRGQIKKWKQDFRHLRAQELGRDQWYSSFQVQVVEILNEYGRGEGF